MSSIRYLKNICCSNWCLQLWISFTHGLREMHPSREWRGGPWAALQKCTIGESAETRRLIAAEVGGLRKSHGSVRATCLSLSHSLTRFLLCGSLCQSIKAEYVSARIEEASGLLWCRSLQRICTQNCCVSSWGSPLAPTLTRNFAKLLTYKHLSVLSPSANSSVCSLN